MKKTIGLILLFLILAAMAWFAMNKKDGSQSMYAIDKDFSIEQTSQIHKIFIADRSGEKPTELKKNGDHWVFNDKYRARNGAINLLLDAAKRMRVKHLVPASAIENLTANMASEGILVRLFDASGKKVKGFYVGGMTNDERGTYMALEGSDKPYVMHIPSWEGNLRQRFSIKGTDWRDRAVFAHEVEDISSVSIEYPKQKSQSFILNRTGEDYTVVPFYKTTPKNKNGLKRGIGESYLVNFKSIIAENFENENPRQDSLLQTIPFCTINLKDNKGKEKEVKLFPLIPKGTISPDGKEIERYFAATNEGDFMLVQHRVFKKIFWGYSLFFKE